MPPKPKRKPYRRKTWDCRHCGTRSPIKGGNACPKCGKNPGLGVMPDGSNPRTA